MRVTARTSCVYPVHNRFLYETFKEISTKTQSVWYKRQYIQGNIIQIYSMNQQPNRFVTAIVVNKRFLMLLMRVHYETVKESLRIYEYI